MGLLAGMNQTGGRLQHQVGDLSAVARIYEGNLDVGRLHGRPCSSIVDASEKQLQLRFRQPAADLYATMAVLKSAAAAPVPCRWRLSGLDSSGARPSSWHRAALNPQPRPTHKVQVYKSNDVVVDWRRLQSDHKSYKPFQPLRLTAHRYKDPRSHFHGRLQHFLLPGRAACPPWRAKRDRHRLIIGPGYGKTHLQTPPQRDHKIPVEGPPAPQMGLGRLIWHCRGMYAADTTQFPTGICWWWIDFRRRGYKPGPQKAHRTGFLSQSGFLSRFKEQFARPAPRSQIRNCASPSRMFLPSTSREPARTSGFVDTCLPHRNLGRFA